MKSVEDIIREINRGAKDSAAGALEIKNNYGMPALIENLDKIKKKSLAEKTFTADDKIKILSNLGGVDALKQYRKFKEEKTDIAYSEYAVEKKSTLDKIEETIKNIEDDIEIEKVINSDQIKKNRDVNQVIEELTKKFDAVNAVKALKKYNEKMQAPLKILLDEELPDAEKLQGAFKALQKEEEANAETIKNLKEEVETELKKISSVDTAIVDKFLGKTKDAEPVVEAVAEVSPDVPGPPDGPPPGPPDGPPPGPPGPPPDISGPPGAPPTARGGLLSQITAGKKLRKTNVEAKDTAETKDAKDKKDISADSSKPDMMAEMRAKQVARAATPAKKPDDDDEWGDGKGSEESAAAAATAKEVATAALKNKQMGMKFQGEGLPKDPAALLEVEKEKVRKADSDNKTKIEEIKKAKAYTPELIKQQEILKKQQDEMIAKLKEQKKQVKKFLDKKDVIQTDLEALVNALAPPEIPTVSEVPSDGAPDTPAFGVPDAPPLEGAPGPPPGPPPGGSGSPGSNLFAGIAAANRAKQAAAGTAPDKGSASSPPSGQADLAAELAARLSKRAKNLESEIEEPEEEELEESNNKNKWQVAQKTAEISVAMDRAKRQKDLAQYLDPEMLEPEEAAKAERKASMEKATSAVQEDLETIENSFTTNLTAAQTAAVEKVQAAVTKLVAEAPTAKPGIELPPAFVEKLTSAQEAIKKTIEAIKPQKDSAAATAPAVAPPKVAVPNKPAKPVVTVAAAVAPTKPTESVAPAPGASTTSGTTATTTAASGTTASTTGAATATTTPNGDAVTPNLDILNLKGRLRGIRGGAPEPAVAPDKPAEPVAVTVSQPEAAAQKVEEQPPATLVERAGNVGEKTQALKIGEGKPLGAGPGAGLLHGYGTFKGDRLAATTQGKVTDKQWNKIKNKVAEKNVGDKDIGSGDKITLENAQIDIERKDTEVKVSTSKKNNYVELVKNYKITAKILEKEECCIDASPKAMDTALLIIELQKGPQKITPIINDPKIERDLKQKAEEQGANPIYKEAFDIYDDLKKKREEAAREAAKSESIPNPMKPIG